MSPSAPLSQKARATPTRAFIVSTLWVLGFLVVVTVASGIWLRGYPLPKPTGPYLVGTSILSLTDGSRLEPHSSESAAKRQLVVQLWYPASPSTHPLAPYKRWKETEWRNFYEAFLPTDARLDAPLSSDGKTFPVLIFGHRWGGDRVQDTALAEELASHGYIVASVDHPYNSDRVLLGDGQVITGAMDMNGPAGENATSAERIAFWNQQLDVWTADDLFVLNTLAVRNADATSPFYQRLDMSHVGAFGHSFGGAASFSLCGLDPHIKAAVNLDGWTFGGLDRRTSSQQIMVVYEGVQTTQSREAFNPSLPDTVQHQLDRADIEAVSRSLERFGGTEVTVAGTQHMDFTDQPFLPPLRRKSTGPIAPSHIGAIDNALVLSFFDLALKGKPEPWLDNPHSRFPEVEGGPVSQH